MAKGATLPPSAAAPQAPRIAPQSPRSGDTSIQVVVDGRSLIAQVQALQSETIEILGKAKAGSAVFRKDRESGELLAIEDLREIDFKAVASLIGQAKGCLELQAKLLGELKAAATTVNVYASPDWTKLRDVILAALTAHPAALADVVAAIERAQRPGE